MIVMLCHPIIRSSACIFLSIIISSQAPYILPQFCCINLFTIFMYLKLCLATATHIFKCENICHIFLIWDETFTNIDVLTLFSVAISVIWSTGVYQILNNHMCPRLTLWPPYELIGISTHLKLCLADAFHSFKWVETIQIWQNWG